MRIHDPSVMTIALAVCVLATSWPCAGAEVETNQPDKKGRIATTWKPPETNGGWRKYEDNPVFGGGELGTCFDATFLRAGDEYWMYVSWRPKHSIAPTKSTDGIHWCDPVIVLRPDGIPWAKMLNRQIIIKRDGRYHMSYGAETHRAVTSVIMRI